MKAVVLYGPKDVSLGDLPVLPLAADEVRVRIAYCGICGSDFHKVAGKKNTHPVKYPVALGHEISGVVAEIGSAVKGLQVGDRVTVDPNWSCGKCRYCQEGKTSFCEHARGVVKGMAPFLSGIVKIVPGNTGNKFRDALFIQQEALPVVVHLAAAVVGIDGDVADDLNALLLQIGVEVFPLHEEDVLQKTVVEIILFRGQAAGQIFAGLPDPGIFPDIGQHFFLTLPGGKAAGGPAEIFFPLFGQLVVVTDAGSGILLDGLHLSRGQQALFFQKGGVDEQGVLGEGRHGAVRAGVPAGDVEGQNLPNGKPTLRQKIRKAIGVLPKGAAAEGSGQGGDM